MTAPSGTTNPRIITLTVRRLKTLAKELRASGLYGDAERLRAWADELNAFDARESRKDPSTRKRRKAAKAKRAGR